MTKFHVDSPSGSVTVLSIDINDESTFQCNFTGSFVRDLHNYMSLFTTAREEYKANGDRQSDIKQRNQVG